MNKIIVKRFKIVTVEEDVVIEVDDNILTKNELIGAIMRDEYYNEFPINISPRKKESYEWQLNELPNELEFIK